MTRVKLTSMKNGLGYVSPSHELVNYPYNIENVDSVYTSESRKKDEAKSRGQYQAYAYMLAPNRKREVCINIGFDKNGNYQSYSINHGRGYFPKKVQQSLLEQLIDWLIKDGWAIKEAADDGH